MSKAKFRHPSEMQGDEVKVPVSVRVKTSTRDELELVAKKHGLSLALLVSNVLDDYVMWLDSDGKKRS